MLGFNRRLARTNQRINKKSIFGFDIETYDKNKQFYCGSIVGDNNKDSNSFIYDKQKMIDHFKTKPFRNSIIGATNLSFDFMGLFYNSDEMDKFKVLFRGSELIFAKAYIKDNKFVRLKDADQKHSVTFLDTFNYARLSVEKLGGMLNMPKFDKPQCIGRLPKTREEQRKLLQYNFRDSEITQRSIKFLYDSFHKLGATPKATIASTALSLYKNKYLPKSFFRHDQDVLLDQFDGYTGGRCEATMRGIISDKNYKMYDFNSMYPAVMRNEFPDPNHLRISSKNRISIIEQYEGMSLVEISVPYMEYPLLPFRTPDKLLFGYGTLKAWFTHIELRKAMDLGCTIKRVIKSYYYLATCYPFKEFVEDLYDLRLKYKKQRDPMELVIKLILNSLYGKFGQKFMDRDNWIPIPDSVEDLHKLDFFERVGDFLRIKKDEFPRAFCFPIWSSYVTAMGRLKIFDYINRSHAIYYDTDSLITLKDYESSDMLGGLKLEKTIKKGIIVKPKFYALKDSHGKEYVRIKGLGTNLTFEDFKSFLINPVITYTKFMRFKESVRRGFIPNELQQITKELGLEDNKRLWDSEFSFSDIQSSQPLKVIEGISELEYEKQELKAKHAYERVKEKEMEAFIKSDLFDSESVGSDITPQEFINNEKWFAYND